MATSQRLVLTAREHASLVALGEADVRRIISSSTDQIGLGRFVPVDTDDNGDPVVGTDWFTAHPDDQANAVRAPPKLQERLQWVIDPANSPRVKLIVDDMKVERAKPEMPELDEATLKARLVAAGGDVLEIPRTVAAVNQAVGR